MTPIRALLVSHGAGLGGAERVLMELVEGLDRRVVDPTLVVPEAGALAEAARSLDVPVLIVPAPWWLPFDTEPEPGYLFRRYWEEAPRIVAPLANIISSKRIDVVYSCSSPILHGALAAHVTRRPHVQHMQDLLGWPHLGLHLPLGSAQVAYRLLGSLSSLVVCVGNASREDIGQAIAADKCRVVPLGFRPPTSAPQAFKLDQPGDSVIRIGTVGAIDRRKGAEVIAHIVQRVCVDVPNAHFYWAGHGEPLLVARLSAEATIAGVPHLHFVGVTRHVADFMHAMDFVLHPARNETFPRVLIEGGLQARAIVTTRSGGGQEIVRDGVNGRVVPVDDVEAISTAVIALARDPEGRRTMGLAARGLASSFGMAAYQAGMQAAILEGYRRGPAVRSAVISRALNLLLETPGRLVPPLRRWATTQGFRS